MIINTDEIKNIYVAKQFCDMRKQIDDLALIVTSQFSMTVLDHSLFIFTNASRNRIKMLYYESNGFWLCSSLHLLMYSCACSLNTSLFVSLAILKPYFNEIWSCINCFRGLSILSIYSCK